MTTRQIAAQYIMNHSTDVEQGKFHRLRVTLSRINTPAFCLKPEDVEVEADCYDPRLNEGRPGEDACEVMFTTSETTADGLYFELGLAPEDRP